MTQASARSDGAARRPRTQVVIGVVIREGCVLVGRRKRRPLRGFAEFPGGKVQPGETRERALVRELREETGIEVKVGQPLARSRVSGPDGALDLTFYLCVPEGDDGTPPREPFRWVAIGELGGLRFPPPNRPVLEFLAARGFTSG